MPKMPLSHYERQRKQSRKANDKAYDERRSNNPALAEVRRIRNTQAYKNFVKIAFNENPICADPFKYHEALKQTVATHDIHHIEGAAKNLQRIFDLTNVTGLCVECHYEIEQLERSGKDTKGMFAKWKPN